MGKGNGMSIIAVIFLVCAVLTVCGALAWLGEMLERKLDEIREERTQRRKLEGLRVGKRNPYFLDGAVQ